MIRNSGTFKQCSSYCFILVIFMMATFQINLYLVNAQEQTSTDQEIYVSIHVSEGNLNGPSLNGVQVTAVYGNNNEQTKITDNDGNVEFAGAPGSWQFSAYKEGFRTPDVDETKRYGDLSYFNKGYISKSIELKFTLLHFVSENGILFIYNSEGCKLSLYNDSDTNPNNEKNEFGDCCGSCTIGIGHLVQNAGQTCDKISKEKLLYTLNDRTLDFGRGLTKDDAIELFKDDIRKKAEIDINRLLKTSLNQNEFDALADFKYQNTWAKSKNLMAIVNQGDDAKIFDGFLNGCGGYCKRRISERELFKNGAYGDLHPIICSPTPLEPGERCKSVNWNSLTPTLKWTSVEDADRYYVYLRDTETKSLVISGEAVNAPATSYSVPSGKLEPNKHYRWNVVAVHLDGSEEINSVSSDRLNFNTIGSPLNPVTTKTTMETDDGNEPNSNKPSESSIVGEWTLHSRSASKFAPSDSIIMFYTDKTLHDSIHGVGNWSQTENTVHWEFDKCDKDICTRHKTIYDGTIDLDMKGKMLTCDGEEGDWSADRRYNEPGIMV